MTSLRLPLMLLEDTREDRINIKWTLVMLTFLSLVCVLATRVTLSNPNRSCNSRSSVKPTLYLLPMISDDFRVLKLGSMVILTSSSPLNYISPLISKFK